MPFDATSLSLTSHIADRLLAMGITPVPPSVVDQHKEKVVAAFCTSMRGRGLVRSGAAVWSTLHIYRSLEILRRPRRHLGMTSDVSAAPRPILRLAEHVSREMRDVEFEVEWFYTDPILNVVCGGRRACLGVWDNGKIVAIADHEDYVPHDADEAAPRVAFWRRWLGLS